MSISLGNPSALLAGGSNAEAAPRAEAGRTTPSADEAGFALLMAGMLAPPPTPNPASATMPQAAAAEPVQAGAAGAAAGSAGGAMGGLPWDMLAAASEETGRLAAAFQWPGPQQVQSAAAPGSPSLELLSSSAGPSPAMDASGLGGGLTAALPPAVPGLPGGSAAESDPPAIGAREAGTGLAASLQTLLSDAAPDTLPGADPGRIPNLASSTRPFQTAQAGQAMPALPGEPISGQAPPRPDGAVALRTSTGTPSPAAQPAISDQRTGEISAVALSLPASQASAASPRPVAAEPQAARRIPSPTAAARADVTEAPATGIGEARAMPIAGPAEPLMTGAPQADPAGPSGQPPAPLQAAGHTDPGPSSLPGLEGGIAFDEALPPLIPEADTGTLPPAPALALASRSPSLPPAEAQPAAPALAQRAHLAAEAAPQLVLRMAQATRDGVDSISVDLRPPELGRVELQMTFRDNGVQVVLRAEQPETFEALRQERHHLEQQMADAGLQLGAGGLDLQQGPLARHEREGEAPRLREAIAEPDDAAAGDGATQRPAASDSLIDLIA